MLNSHHSHKTEDNISYSNTSTLPTSVNSRQETSRQNVNQFNQNEFSLACNGKIKFNEIESSLRNKILHNDSPQALALFYTAIIRSIGYGFETQLPFLPTFQGFTKTTVFQNIFMSGLHDATYHKCLVVFQRIGDLLKEKLLHPLTITKKMAPKAYDVIWNQSSIIGRMEFIREIAL